MRDTASEQVRASSRNALCTHTQRPWIPNHLATLHLARVESVEGQGADVRICGHLSHTHQLTQTQTPLSIGRAERLCDTERPYARNLTVSDHLEGQAGKLLIWLVLALDLLLLQTPTAGFSNDWLHSLQVDVPMDSLKHQSASFLGFLPLVGGRSTGDGK